ncbi:MAG: NAD-dependent epimerase/dehydratase family protein [Chloroflexi bacterium]|nr:NAD-dependent epimerase/dehydratase family protein [Chloroflexota bacterium]
MKILVTGGAGFIGSHLVDLLLATGHQVVVVDNLSTGKRAQVPATASLVVMDIRDAGLAALVKSEAPAVICHLAAIASVPTSVKDPVTDAGVGVSGSVNLFHAAIQSGVRKVVYASSMAIFGAPQYLPIDEGHPTHPDSPYGLSKLTAEGYLSLFAHLSGIRYTILRFANVYGPRQESFGEAGVVTTFCERLLRGLPPIVNGDGEQTRDFVYVQDIARANLLALDRADNQVLNLGSGTSTSINQLARLSCQIAGFSGALEYGPPRPAEIRDSVVDPRRTLEHLGWQAEVPFTTGLAETLAFFRSGVAP